MNKFSLSIIVLFFTAATCLAQDVTYKNVKEEFMSFNYQNVIRLSDTLIKKGNLSDSLLIDVYLMRAVCFSYSDLQKVRECYQEVLKINKDFPALPTNYYSPEMAEIFNEVKTSYLASLNPPAQRDSTQIQMPAKIFDSAKFGNSAALNLFIPGLGQMNTGNTTKGIILTAASTAALGTMIYTIINTNKKENDYLKESNKNLIPAKYEAFNNAYKTRNVLIVTYAAIWAFSQIDFIFNTDENSFMKENTSLGNNKFKSKFSEISLGFSIPLR